VTRRETGEMGTEWNGARETGRESRSLTAGTHGCSAEPGAGRSHKSVLRAYRGYLKVLAGGNCGQLVS
jgi:hypothetical protein